MSSFTSAKSAAAVVSKLKVPAIGAPVTAGAPAATPVPGLAAPVSPVTGVPVPGVNPALPPGSPGPGAIGTGPFTHQGVTPGSCMTCHNGRTAPGKPANHLPTNLSCDSCHRTTAWKPATFTHNAVAPGSCLTCHNGQTVSGKSASHFVTTRSCDACHRTTAWRPVNRYDHLSPAYKQHNTSVTCTSCHTTNSETIAWKFSAYKPDCAGCHASRFKPDAHKKVESPAILYTAAELKDCSGSCHLYTDNTLSKIKKTRTGQHRPTGGGF